MSKAHGKAWANVGISLEIDKGSMVVVTGPDASGKTTLLSIMAGLESPSSGSRVVYGSTAFVSASNRTLIPWCTVSQHVLLTTRLAGCELGTQVLEACELEEVADRSVESLSPGEARRVALAMALSTGPSILVVDEPLVSVDPVSEAIICRVLCQHRDSGGCVILSSRQVETFEVMADRVCVLSGGRVVAYDSPAGLQEAQGDVVQVQATLVPPGITELRTYTPFLSASTSTASFVGLTWVFTAASVRSEAEREMGGDMLQTPGTRASELISLLVRYHPDIVLTLGARSMTLRDALAVPSDDGPITGV